MIDVVVVGGGPAGLASAIELRQRGASEVVVLDREQQGGGIPRHCFHQGFGLRDLRRVLSGPSYARRYVEKARRAGVTLQTEAMVTGWAENGGLQVTTADGRQTLTARAVVLATGCRERPRAARLVPGSRPDGVLTTGILQQLVERSLPTIGSRAVIVGAEHVSFSALLTLAHAGVRVLGMVTSGVKHESVPGARLAASLRYRVPVWTRTEVSDIRGMTRVEGVVVRNLDSGEERFLACDTVVFTADWIPDHELAVTGGLELDDGTRGPQVDSELRTTRVGVFAAGNLLQGAEPADIAALSGRHVAAAVARWLGGDSLWPERVPILCRPPLQWISPNAVSSSSPPLRKRFAVRSSVLLSRPELEIQEGGRLLWRGRLRQLVPGRSGLVSATWLRRIEGRGPIEIGLRSR